MKISEITLLMRDMPKMKVRFCFVLNCYFYLTLLWVVRWLRCYCARLRIEPSGASPSRGHCAVSSGKAHYSHSASFHPGVLG